MSGTNKTASLSKSLYTRGLQCHKSLYLHKYHPELRGSLRRSSRRSGQVGTRSAILPACCSRGEWSSPTKG